MSLINWKLFNIRDILFIAVIVVVVHILATPIYNRLDNKPDANSPAA